VQRAPGKPGRGDLIRIRIYLLSHATSKTAEFIKSAQSAADYPADGIPHIAVAGRSNVGKSSPAQTCWSSARGLVKTSQAPGKTRLINFFLVNKGGPPGESFYLVDIPGFTATPRWAATRSNRMEDAIDGYFRTCKQLRGLLYLVERAHDRQQGGTRKPWNG